MRNRTVVAILLGTVALFVWQTLSNTVIPWHNMTEHMVNAGSAQAKAVHAAVPDNGIYMMSEGLVVVSHTTPDFADRSKTMGAQMGIQFVIDLVCAWVIAMMLPRLAGGRSSAVRTMTMAAFGAGVLYAGSLANWFGYPVAYTAVNIVEQMLNFALTAWVIHWWMHRASPAPSSADESRDAGVAAGGGLPSGERVGAKA